MNFRRTRKFLFSFLFVSTFLFASQRQVVGSVTLSWDKIGDSNLIISYNGEELHPCGQWHKHAGGYTSNQAKKMQTDVLQKAKRMRGRLYRLNKIKFTFWDYIKSFFAKPPQVKTQKYVLFSDGTEETSGLSGKIKESFVSDSRMIFAEFKKLQQLRGV